MIKNVAIMGSVPKGEENLGGQTVKTQEIIDYLSSLCNVYFIDVDEIRSYPYKLFIKLFVSLRNNDVLILIISDNAYSYVMPIIFLFNIIWRCRIIEVVIGGVRYKSIRKNFILRKIAKRNECIYVESLFMEAEYHKMGFDNCEYLSNFKSIKPCAFVDLKKYSGEILNVCTFSRVDQYKGVNLAIYAVNMANEKLGKKAYELTVYGPVDASYLLEFQKLQEVFKNCVKYGGVIPYKNSVDVLKHYSMLIFPTLWDTEGFPGSIIDAYASGIPIVSSDKGQIPYIVKGKTGIIISNISIEKLTQTLIELYFKRDKLIQMARNALEESYLYTTENVLKKMKSRILEDDSFN